MEHAIILLVVAGVCVWFGLRVRRFVRSASKPSDEDRSVCDMCSGCAEESCEEREQIL